MITQEEVQEFYDGFDKRLIDDYLGGNQRIEYALEFILNNISPGKRVLDVGCGIGWSSFELSKVSNYVCAVDLSERLIDVAKRLFIDEKISFYNRDITKKDFLKEGTFDVITMIDVYEHIPLGAREEFGKSLKKLLAESGSLFLTCPSKYHQAYLRNNKPEGLQPIDEDVTIQDLDLLAKTIGGDITQFGYRSIWDDYDYFHVIIQKNPIQKISTNHHVELEKKVSRLSRVKKTFPDLYSSRELNRLSKTWLYKVYSYIRS